MRRIGPVVLILCALILPPVSSSQSAFDLVILNGRVIDPESRSDAVRNLSISNGVIKAISSKKLAGRKQRDQKSLINYGVSAGHLAARMAAMHEPVTFLPTGEAARRPATDAEIKDEAASS